MIRDKAIEFKDKKKIPVPRHEYGLSKPLNHH